jgi:hypothetical protein
MGSEVKKTDSGSLQGKRSLTDHVGSLEEWGLFDTKEREARELLEHTVWVWQQGAGRGYDLGVVATTREALGISVAVGSAEIQDSPLPMFLAADGARIDLWRLEPTRQHCPRFYSAFAIGSFFRDLQ